MQIIQPDDGGPIYAETNLSGIIAEPWNAISSLAIVLPSIYWAIRLKGNVKQFAFLYFLIPLLFLGGTGSLLYHAFRNSRFLLWMDVVPTAIVTFAVSVYFWDRLLPKKWLVAVIIVPVTFMRFFLLDVLPGQLSVNVSYFITGFLIFFPLLVYEVRNKMKYFKPIFISVICLSASLAFRRLDHSFTWILPMGSHFLWHIFSGIGAYYLALFIYLIRRDDLRTELP
ncbi:MAG: ceramidase domain-containing protein [Ekhidna sp.]